MLQTHQGACFCGAVQIEVSGEPLGMTYCHCSSCRSWAAAPLHTSSLWQAADVKVKSGSELVATFCKTPETISHRQFCTKCGGHLMIHHPAFGMYDVMTATLPTLEFAPTMHVNYSETVLPMKDGLPKYAGFPKEFGGTGELLPE